MSQDVDSVMRPETWLITGGAGYIGAHVADEFLSDGKNVIILDSLVNGLKSRIDYLSKKHNKLVPLVIADIRDNDTIEKVLAQHTPFGIVHLAALKSVSESLEKSDEYMDVNFHSTKYLTSLTTKFGIEKFIFSSTAAVYGSPILGGSVKEDDIKSPIAPYGLSKLFAEDEVLNFLKGKSNRGTILRFFNVIGSSAKELVDNSTENLVPIVINRIKNSELPEIFGVDYPTKDGTCIRDYVDVRDVARVHLLAANANFPIPPIMNIGTGNGTSVKEIINEIQTSLGLESGKYVEKPRRQGDLASLFANVDLLGDVFPGALPKISLSSSINSVIST